MDDLKLYVRNNNNLNSLLEIVKDFSDDIGMEFCLSKCIETTFNVKFVKSSNIVLGINISIKKLQQEEIYKYIGIQEGNNIQHSKMKEKIRKEWYRTVCLILDKTEFIE